MKEKVKKTSKSVRRKIMLVDDHPMLRVGVTALINGESDLIVCSHANSAEEALKELTKHSPDLLITDMTMPGRGGLELIKDLKALYPNLPVLVVSMHDEMIYAERVLRAGARGYIMKEAGGDKMLEAIRKVLSGQIYVSEKISLKIIDLFFSSESKKGSSPIEKLTDREFEVLQLIGEGKSIKEIANQLHLSSKTVDVHRGNAKEKLGLKDAADLLRYAVRWTEAQK